MRILLTTDTIGGVWTFTQELCAGLLERGHSVALVSLGRMPSPAQTTWCGEMNSWYWQRFRFHALDLPLEWMTSNHAAYTAAEPELLRITRDFDAELFHTNQFCFGALPVNIPKVLTAHSDVLSWAEACRPQGLEESEWLSRYRMLVQNGLTGSSAVVAPTRWMAGALRRGFPQVDEAAIKVIFNGRKLTCSSEPARDRILQAVSVGRRWDEAKGLTALDNLDSAMPVVLAGETRLDQLNGQGALGEREIRILFSFSSVYIAASIYEPFGLAPLEAALCGCAVVANDIPSLREVWGESAIFYRSRTELQNILNRLVTSGNELRCAQLMSRARALELSSSVMVDAYFDLYTSLVARPEQRLPPPRMAYAS